MSDASTTWASLSRAAFSGIRPHWRRLTGGTFARNVALILSGTAIGQVIVIAASPLLTRLYTPSDFGVLSVYVSVIGLAVVAASLRYEIAIPLPETDTDGANLMALSLGLVGLASIVVGLAALLGGPIFLRHSSYQVLQPYLWLFPISVLGAGIYQVLSFWAMRQRAFRSLAQTKVNQSVSQVVSQLALGLVRVGPVGLLLGDAIGRTGGSWTLAVLAWRRDRNAIRGVSWQGMRSMARRYSRFPIFSSGSALLNAATLQVPLLMLAAFYGPTVAGLFALGQRLLAAPMSIVGTAIANVYYSELAGVARQDSAKLQPLFIRMTKRLALVGIGPVAIAAALGPTLCSVAFGSRWAEAGMFLRLCAPMLLLQFVASPLGGTLDVLERQDLHLAREIFRQALLLVALVAAKVLKFDAWHAVLVFSIAGTLGNAVYICSTWYALRNVSTPTLRIAAA